MKKYAISFLIFVSLFIYGCDGQIDSKDKTKMDYKVIPVDNPVTKKLTEQVEVVNITAIKKQKQINKKLTQTASKKKSIKVNQNKDQKIVAIETNSDIEITKNPLDLSVPFTISSAKNINFILKSNGTSYLPDLFADRKDSSVQLVGKFIKREEIVLGKEATTDGAGVDFKLSH